MVNVLTTTVGAFRRLFNLLKALASLLFLAIWLTIVTSTTSCVFHPSCQSLNPNLDDTVYSLQTYLFLPVRLEALCLPASQAMVASGRRFRRPFRPPTLVHPVQRMFPYPFRNAILTHPRLNALANHGM